MQGGGIGGAAMCFQQGGHVGDPFHHRQGSRVGAMGRIWAMERIWAMRCIRLRVRLRCRLRDQMWSHGLGHGAAHDAEVQRGSGEGAVEVEDHGAHGHTGAKHCAAGHHWNGASPGRFSSGLDWSGAGQASLTGTTSVAG